MAISAVPADAVLVRRFAVAYAVCGVALLGLAALTGASPRWDALPWLAGSSLGAVAVGVGLRVHRPRRRRFWIAIGGMQLSWAAASLVPLAGGPSIASAAYGTMPALFLPGYAMLGWATITLLWKVGAGRPETLDAAIGTAVAGVLMWPFVVHAVAVSGQAGLLGALFPAWDLLLAMLLLRILFSAWSAKRSLRLLAVATLVLLTSDLFYFGSVFAGSSLAGRLLSTSYTAAYLLFGAAALDRSMRRFPPRALPRAASRRRTLLVMTCALLLTPAIFFVEEALQHDWNNAVIAAIGALIVGLVVVRVAKLLRHTEALRRRAEESEHLFRTVFDSAGVGISVGTNGTFSRTNPALQTILGYTADELAGRHFNEVTHPDDHEIGTVAVHGAKTTFQKRYIRSDGETIWAEVTLTKPTADGHAIAVIEDVTAAKRLEADLRHAQKMEAVGQLAGGVAHDFNNLMTAVIGYSGMLKRELAAGDARQTRVDAISGAAERAAELTRKLLAFSRRQVLRLEALDVADAVAGFDPILRPLLPETIVVDYALERGAVARVDRQELEQVLLNLCLNARDAMVEGGLLTVRVGRGADSVELTVADTGVGMSDDVRLRIFDPFFTTKPVGQGTGLGLSTVDGIVAQLGGTIEVDSTPGSGTTFTIRLPHSDAPPLDPGVQSLEPGNGGAVLLVEDEEIVRNVTTEMLRLIGYEVFSAASAEDALLVLADGLRPDVLVSDVVMTGMDGPSLAFESRKLIPHLPVLFVSGYPSESLRGRTAEAVLTKPFTPAQLAERIEHVRSSASLA